jgi:1,4-alpha-glucan branching enzyme
MHDTLQYFSLDPVFRKYHHGQLTFRGVYAFSENFMLPFSHDEVVHGKGSMLGKMPGDEWQRFANLRLLFGYMFLQPGKKLLFMGAEFGQPGEWNHDGSLAWHVTHEPSHGGVQKWVTDLNGLYRNERALHEGDVHPHGFEWIDCNDADQSTMSWIRRGRDTGEVLLAVFNFTPMVRSNYRVGVPHGGFWTERLNSDAREYGGSGQGNFGGVESIPYPCHGRPHTLIMTLPPLGMVVFKGTAL